MLRLTPRLSSEPGFERPDNMSEPLHQLLCARGIASLEEAERFLNPGIDQLHDPLLFPDMDAALALIQSTRDQDWPVCVYGDYDVDGVSATAILQMGLSQLGMKVEPRIPSRHEDGYGLNDAAIREIAGWAKLIITVDCGVNAVSQVALARELGLNVIVTDHHQLSDERPDCPLINPLREGYPYPSLCGAGVAFKLLCALDAETGMRFIDLAALATVADVVPLTGENRAIVSLGLCVMREKPRPGLLQLMRLAGVDAAAVKSGNIAFQIGPRLNAGGRLGDANRALSLLTAASAGEAQPLAEALEQENLTRREVEAAILKDAYAQMDGFDFLNRRAIVLHGDDWNVGVIGLAAARLAERYHLPCVMLSGEGDALTGSCRSIPGVDIHAALCAVSDLLIRFGGHKQAAGLTIARSNLETFADALSIHVKAAADPQLFIPAEPYDAAAELREIDEPLVGILSRLEPFGMGNPSPRFVSEVRVEGARRIGQAGAHLKLNVSGGGARREAVGWRMGGAELPEPGTARRLLYEPGLNTFNGNTSVQLVIKAMLPPAHAEALETAARHADALLQAFLTETLYNIAYPTGNGSPTPKADMGQILTALGESPCGTLVVATDFAALQALLALASDAKMDDYFDLHIGRWPDAGKPSNAICLLPVGAPMPLGYARLFMLDAPPAILGAQGMPMQRFAPSRRAAWLADIPDVDALRTLYRMVKDFTVRPCVAHSATAILQSLAEDGLISGTAIACGLPVLRQMGLIEYAIRPPVLKRLPAKKADPEASDLYQFLNQLKR